VLIRSVFAGRRDTHSDRLDFRRKPVLGQGVLHRHAAIDAMRRSVAVLRGVPQPYRRQRHQGKNLGRGVQQEAADIVEPEPCPW